MRAGLRAVSEAIKTYYKRPVVSKVTKAAENASFAAQSAAPKSGRESVLREADRLVHGERNASYGHPLDDYACTVALWRAMILRRYGIDVPLTPDFGCLMMAAMKLSREAGKPKRDNRVDGAGYFECADWIIDEIKAREGASIPPVSHK